jgi:hypothetical protein
MQNLRGKPHAQKLVAACLRLGCTIRAVIFNQLANN